MGKKSFFIVGSYMAKKIEPHITKNHNRVGDLYVFLKENEGSVEYINRFVNQLKKQLLNCNPDYLVIELQALLEAFDNDTTCVSEEKINVFIEDLIGCIKSSIKENRVYVIRTNVPSYYIMGECHLKQITNKTEINRNLPKLNYFEDKLAEEVNGIKVNITRFYFYKKRTGYLLNAHRYENECYLDISSKISSHMEKEKKIANVPSPKYKIERYIRYSDRSNFYEALDVFMTSDNIVDKLILSAPSSFVEKYKEDLLEARKIKAKTPEEWKEAVYSIFSGKEELQEVLVAFFLIECGKYDEFVSYKTIFQLSIASRDLISILQKFVIENKIASGKQINNHNAGYFFALMNGKTQEEALEYVKKDTVIFPALIDVFGSCVSRTCLMGNYTNRASLSENNYWFEVPPYTDTTRKPNYDPSVFDGLSDVFAQVVKSQLDGSVKSEILNSDAEWIIIDLHPLAQPRIYQYDGFIYYDHEGKVSKRLGSERIDVLHDERFFKDWDDLFASTKGWAETVKEKYGNNIIVLQVSNSNLIVGDDKVLYANTNKESDEEKTKFLEKALEYFRDNLNCYTIEITSEFCSDDCGYMKRSRVHYGYDFYQQAAKIIENIVYNKPEQKRFTTYDSLVKVERIITLREQNCPSAVQNLFSSEIDKAVINLPFEVIKENKDIIVSWYENGIKDINTLKENWQTEWDSFPKSLILGKECVESSSYQYPTDYPDEPSLGPLTEYQDTIPVGPQLYYKDELNRTIETVNSLIDEQSLVFINVTDIHYKSAMRRNGNPVEVNFERMIANMEFLLKHVKCEFIMNLGDDTDGNFTDIGDLYKAAHYVQSNILKLNIPYYKAIGNHDTNCFATPIDVKKMYNAYMTHLPLLYKNIVFNPQSFGTEYYIDYEKYGIRLIVLNTMFDGLFSYSDSTPDWLRNEALKTDKLILLCEHLSCVHTMNMNAKPIKHNEEVIKVLKEFKGKIIQICGHSHCDYHFDYYDEKLSPFLTVFCNLQRCSRRRQSDIGDITEGFYGKFGCPKREPETVSEDCWDVVIVRPNYHKINFVRFGAGEDREFDY